MALGLEDLFKYEKEVELGDDKTKVKVLLRTISSGEREKTLKEIEEFELAEIKRLTEEKDSFIRQAEIDDNDEAKVEVLAYIKAKNLDALSISDDLLKQKDNLVKRFSKEIKEDRDKVLSTYTDAIIKEMAFNTKFKLYIKYVVSYATLNPETKEKLFQNIEDVNKLDEKIINQIFIAYSDLEPPGEELKNSQPPTTT